MNSMKHWEVTMENVEIVPVGFVLLNSTFYILHSTFDSLFSGSAG